MGTDINGWVEVREYNQWHGVICVTHLLSAGNTDAFGCLFGVTNLAHFTPLVSARGLPPDLSREFLGDLTGTRDQETWDAACADFAETFKRSGYYGPSWILWSEIEAMDLDEDALEADERLHDYRKKADGTLVLIGKGVPGPAQLRSLFGTEDRSRIHWKDGLTWEAPEYVHKVQRLKRRDAFDLAWRVLFSMMNNLAELYGTRHVRLTVWFDM